MLISANEAEVGWVDLNWDVRWRKERVLSEGVMIQPTLIRGHFAVWLRVGQ